MIKKEYKPYLKVFIQIFLVISMSWAFSYTLHQSEGVVSAQEEPIINTCSTDCQEYSPEQCKSVCEGECIESSKDNVDDCDLGVCFDSITGTCSEGSPKKLCLDDGGEWGVDLDECELGCCLSGDNALLITNRACDYIEESGEGLTDFKPEFHTLIECVNEINSQVEGACIIGSGEDKTCVFITERKFEELKSKRTDVFFYPNFLCSHPGFEMNYTPYFNTGCVEGKDEVYWFDNQGNRENIWEGDSNDKKIISWNNGMVKSKSDSCSLGLFNMDNCGNCDEFGTTSTKCDASGSKAVCKDISCEWRGKHYLNRESWCYYQGSVLPKETTTIEYGKEIITNRSTSVPGSRYFRLNCEDGKVYNTSCGDRRQGICEQQIITREYGDNFSLADCRPNFAEVCLGYNTWEDKDNAMETCAKNPDCFVKEIKVNYSPFNFEVCTPKYSLGFNSSSENSILNGQAFCGIASMDCESARVKKIDGGVKTINKGCTKEYFTEQMHNFCMSLGDCGASVNYLGVYSNKGYSTSRPSADLNKDYVDLLKTYSGKFNEYIPRLNVAEMYRVLTLGEGGIDNTIGETNFPESREEDAQRVRDNTMAVGGTVMTVGIALLPSPVGIILIAVGVITMFAGYYLEASGIAPGLTHSQMNVLMLDPIGSIFIVTFAKWAGVGKVHKSTTSFTCMPWSPPTGGKDCGKCYDEGFGCSEYSCKSLGTMCEFYNEGTSFEKCIAEEENENPPTIKPLINEEIPSEGFEYVELKEGDENFTTGFKVVSTNTEDGCVPAFTPITIGLELSKRGRCTFTVPSGAFKESDVIDWLNESAGEYSPADFNLTNFLGKVDPESSLQGSEDNYSEDDFTGVLGSEEYWFGGNNLYFINHTHTLYYPSLASLGERGFDPNTTVNFDMRIRCEDRNDRIYPVDYGIRTCLSREKRLVVPVIIDSKPARGLVKNNATNAEFSVYINYPSDCKWDLNGDKIYDLMENTFSCKNKPNEMVPRPNGLIGFECSSNTEMISDNVTVYVKCRDQPWLAGTPNETDRNTMNDSYPLTIRKSSPLKIDSIIPNDNKPLEFGKEPAVIEIDVVTSGGADTGKASCAYWSENSFVDFDVTGDTTTHYQKFDQSSGGHKNMAVRCEDSIGNVALAEKEFDVIIDNEAPKIIRIFQKESKLTLNTNEKAICYYTHKNCNFEMQNATSMSIINSTVHTADWEDGTSYYVRCIDSLGNWKSGCSVIVKTTDI